ncbi:MAG: tRNA pseudouridine(38-40) synthase TruA [Candidatus Brocadiaceae bacterium]|nr:tRNA pseudouridine(38-40) synthase TruA [Candidatus Brocadiaceae bacterium]
MNNIKLVIEYDGTNYVGWQQQKNGISVHEKLTKAIEKTVNECIKLLGAGRTDAGTHAIGQVANFKTKSNIPSFNLVQAINSYLPKDIVVKSAKKVPDKFHSRYSAKSKIYRYTILNSNIRCAIQRNYCHYYSTHLDIEKMQKASKILIGKHDFSVFKSKSDILSSVRTVKMLEIKNKGKYVLFTIEADGFLYKMVRSIVGTLLEVGRGKMTITEFKKIVKSRDRTKAGNTVPAKGLCLLKVKY